MESIDNGSGNLIRPLKSVISVQSKRLAEDINSAYDKQIVYTTKIHHQRSRIEDLKFRIARTEKELVSFPGLGRMIHTCTDTLLQ